MASKFLSNLSNVEYKDLTKRLLSIQNQTCFICQEEIDIDIHETNIDHIIPLANKGKDTVENFALTHSSCNKSKQDSNLNIARIIHKLKKIQDYIYNNENRAASLKDILISYEGSKYNFKYKVQNNLLTYSFSNLGENTLYKEEIYTDKLSQEKFVFIKIPIEYIYHDDIINPRGINNSISKLIKEFDKGNPQLHLSLARIDDERIKIFDGQHKAVAQILLGARELVLRVFLDPNIDRLTETNTNAGSVLRQVAFDKSIMRQLNNTLYFERIKKYQKDHNLNEDDYSFSEQNLVEYFKGENVNLKKYITDSIKHSVTYHQENKLKDYIDFEGKAKDLPISYSAFDKTFLSRFINSKLALNTSINHKSDVGLNPRELEINQFVKLLNVIAEEIYINKFSPEVGMKRIEQKIIDGKDTDITDNHLIAYRISKEEVMYNWLNYLINVITNYFSNKGQMIDSQKLLQYHFDNQLWINIRNFIQNLKSLPLWKDRSMASTVFAGKNNYDYWKAIFQNGKSPDGVEVLIKPLNFVEMIKPIRI